MTRLERRAAITAGIGLVLVAVGALVSAVL